MGSTSHRSPISERRTIFHGYETRELRAGSGGATFVLVHGYGDSADTWRPLLARLAAHGHTAYAVDLPGFGRASRLRREPLLPQLVAFLTAVVLSAADRAGAPVILVGNSLGGLLTLRVAEDETLPVRAAVPIAPGGLDRPSWFKVLSEDVVVRRVLAIPVPIPRRVLALAVGQVYARLAFHRPRAVDPSDVAAFTDHLPSRRSVRRLLAIGRGLVAEVTDTTVLRPDRIEVPLLVVWGEQDRMVAPAGADLLAELVPDVEVVLLPSCGHCPQLEQPDEVMGAIARWMAHQDSLARAA